MMYVSLSAKTITISVMVLSIFILYYCFMLVNKKHEVTSSKSEAVSIAFNDYLIVSFSKTAFILAIGCASLYYSSEISLFRSFLSTFVILNSLLLWQTFNISKILVLQKEEPKIKKKTYADAFITHVSTILNLNVEDVFNNHKINLDNEHVKKYVSENELLVKLCLHNIPAWIPPRTKEEYKRGIVYFCESLDGNICDDGLYGNESFNHVVKFTKAFIETNPKGGFKIEALTSYEENLLSLLKHEKYQKTIENFRKFYHRMMTFSID